MILLHAGSNRPGKVRLAGAAVLGAPALQDSLHTMPIHPVDSIAQPNLLGDHVTPVIQWIFQQSPVVMWGGVVLGAIVALLILRWLWPRKGAILHWIATRSTSLKLAMVGAAVAAVMIAGFAGFQGYHFMETDRRFCNGCHIFVPSGQAWVQPDTGYYSLVPKLEGKHDTINCHTCHTLKPLKEGVKMVMWMSGVRDEKIPPHGKVPQTICRSCHVQGAAKETWQAIATTAGHRTHLESDSSALKDVQCLTCHARTAHRFLPADSTCVQKGCHLTEDTRIVLGKMQGQSDLHCTLCHEFTRPVALLATRDSAAGALRPAMEECFSCHQMKERLPSFTSVNDPHNGSCGTCHNPHVQKVASDTRKSCTTAGCHADWKKIPFHVGAQHKAKGPECLLCHNPHAARVDQSDCEGCHAAVKQRPDGRWVNPPMPFDTTRALQSSAPSPHPDPVLGTPGGVRGAAVPHEVGQAPPRAVPPPRADPVPDRPSKVKGDAPPDDDPPERGAAFVGPLPADSFSHPIHKKLACLTCHVTTSGAKLTFEQPRGCQICHHQQPETSNCRQCHEQGSLPEATAVTFAVAAAGKPARTRTVGFAHAVHDSVPCTACHGQKVTLGVVDSALSCNGCHAQHHEAGRDCATCHRSAETLAAHQAPVRPHTACDACHTTARIAELRPTRSFCLACHEATVDHYPGRECTTCHLQAHPDEYRPKLLKARSAR